MWDLKCPFIIDLWALRDGELSAERAREVEIHIQQCDVCKKEHLELDRLSEILSMGDPAAGIPPTRREKTKEELLRVARSSLSAERAASLTTNDHPVEPKARTAPPIWRRAFLILAPAGAFSLLLLLLFTHTAPADAVVEALEAMSRVRTAHCTGEVVSYFDLNAAGEPIPKRFKVEWWYRAPGTYRRDLTGDNKSASIRLGKLIVKGHNAVFTDSQTGLRFSDVTGFPYLSAMDFFSRQGIIGRAVDENRARVITRVLLRDGREVQLIQLRLEDENSREFWELHVDSITDLILQSEWHREVMKQGEWKPMFVESLRNFEYDTVLKANVFSDGH